MRHREATKALLRASCIVGAVLLSACDLSPIGPVFDPGPIGPIGPNGPNGPTDPNGPAGPVLVAIVGSAIPCESGIAAGYACSNVDLMSFLPLQELGSQAPPGYPPSGTPLNDIWGWTDPQTGIEYALVGRSDGLAFLSLADPESPVFVGELPMTPGAYASSWRDVKVYADHALIVADGARQHGMQVFDLRRLREASEAPVTYSSTAVYHGIASAHNIVINEASGFAYAVGSQGGGETCGGGLHMIDIQDPVNPSFAGCFADSSTGFARTGYTHDAQCIMYAGPDADYQGREICLGANESALSIADVTDKATPRAISTAAYPGGGYVHQG